jgi:arthrofactin-type cyclic lipopeptide synthetase C
MFDSVHPARAGAGSHDAAQEHALLLRALRMAEPTEAGGPPDPDEASVPTGDVDLETFVTRCHEKGLLPGHVTVEQARQTRDRLRNHQRALREYSPQPLPVAVYLFPAQQSADPEPSRGWRAIVPGTQLQVTPVPGTHLSMMRAPNVETLGEALSRRLDDARKGARTRPGDVHTAILKLQTGKPGIAPLFCVPGAGTSVTSFIDLLGSLDGSWPVYGLEPRGLDGTSVPHSTVEAAAEFYLPAVHQACPDGPIHLLGHSFGGWVVFEMALRLRQAGRAVGSLTILDSEVPGESEDRGEADGRDAFLKLVEVVELSAERSFGIGSPDVDSRDEAGRLKLLHQKMHQNGLINARSTYEVLYGPFRTFARCVRTLYHPSGVYPGRLRLVLVPDPRMDDDANRAQFAEMVRGWRSWAPGLVFSPGAGNHVTALKSPHVATLAAFLAEDRGS